MKDILKLSFLWAEMEDQRKRTDLKTANWLRMILNPSSPSKVTKSTGPKIVRWLPKVQNPSIVTSFVCKVDGCNRTFATLKGLRGHQKVHSGASEEDFLQCYYSGCGHKAISETNLRVHVQQPHEIRGWDMKISLNLRIECCILLVQEMGGKDRLGGKCSPQTMYI